VPAFLAPPKVWPFRAEQRIEYIARQDVVSALVACVGNTDAVGAIYNVAGGASWRMRGADYVARTNELLGLDAEDARYSTGNGTFDWYDTLSSQQVLRYQRTSFDSFVEQLGRAIERALGDLE
jgi:hypothetical protein